jgi:mannose-6-phosphate isomerase-like protein (cupin superfamily)
MTDSRGTTEITPSLAAGEALGSWQEWVRQGLLFTEAVRGGPLVWPVGAESLHGDPLGPTRHAHDDAEEYYFFVSGRCLVEIGGEERVVSAGDLVHIPANAPHNLLGEVGGNDAWAFIVVAPNLAHNKWRLSEFLLGSEELRMTVTRPLDGDDGARTNAFRAEALDIRAESPFATTASDGELVGILTAGRAHVRSGLMSGNLGPGDYFHVRRDLELRIDALTERASVLLFHCSFQNFAGAPLGTDA